MSWVKLDDQFPSHPKMVEAGGDAAWLHVCALCYCGQHLTDGFIPKGIVGRLSDRKKPELLAARLVAVGSWIDHGDRYELHGYLEFNPSRAHVLTEREAARERMKNKRRGSPEHPPERAAEVREKFDDPVPSRPEVPTEPVRGAQSAPTPRRNGTRIPDIFRVTDPMAEWAANDCPDVDIPVETQKFVNYWKAKSGRDATKLDWQRTWQNWILKAQQDEERRKSRGPAQIAGRR